MNEDRPKQVLKNSRNPKQQKQMQQARPVAEIQQEVNAELHDVLIEILSDNNQQVKSAHVKTLINMMHKYYKCFKMSFLELLDKIIVFDEKDHQMKGLYKLLEKFYNEISKNPNLNLSKPQLIQYNSMSVVDVNSLVKSTVSQLIEVYCLPKLSFQGTLRTCFMLTQVVSCFKLPHNESIKLESDLKYQLSEAVIDMLNSPRSSTQIYGAQLGSEICNQNKQNDQVYLHLMRIMTHSKSKEVKKAVINNLKGPFSQTTLVFISKRLRDKDDDVRRIAFQKLHKNDIKIENFPSLEQRMLIIKEGLTDSSEFVRAECIEFLKPSLQNEDGTFKEFSHLFKLIDCRKLFIKEYYVQLPFLIMRFIFHCLENQEIKLAEYLQSIIEKLKVLAGVNQEEQEMEENIQDCQIQFEDLLFLRIAYEFTKMYKKDRSDEYLEYLDGIQVDYNDYQQIFTYLLYNPVMVQVPLQKDQKPQQAGQTFKLKPDRLLFSEWMKFSLQLSIEEEMTRRNLVSLMFSYVGKIDHSYEDYRHLLIQNRYLLRDNQQNLQLNDADMDDGPRAMKRRSLALYDSDQEDYEEDAMANLQGEEQQQVIEIEIRAFQDLSVQRDIQEYCKPFSFESLVLDSDDICRIAVIVARKLLDSRIDEFSISMLQAISDIKEPIDEVCEEGALNLKKERDRAYQKLEAKLENVNEIIMQEDYSISDLNRIMRKVNFYVNLIEELNLKEKLSYKRALNMCLILLKQCRADVNDQNMVQICDTLIGPTIKSKDQDNMLLAIECIGLLCLLDKEVFQNYTKIFQRILVEDVIQDNLREKIIALKSSVDSLIIHGVDPKTQKLQKIIIEDYMVIQDKVLRQITIEGICKMLFSRKLTQTADNSEMEFLLSQLIIQWFDKKFNWQNSLVRQILNTFFKSFVLFSQQRCEIMLNSLVKIIFSILEAKYNNIDLEVTNKRGHPQIKKVKFNQNGRNSGFRSSNFLQDEESEDYSVNEDDGYNSDDSRCVINQAKMQNIVAQLDPVQISKVFMLLLSKDYVNQNAAKQFRLHKDLNLEFLIIVCFLNATKFKKVVIVKEFINNIVDYINVNKATDIKQLETLNHYLDLNLKMLISNNQKLKKVKEATEARLAQLQKEQNDYAELLHSNHEYVPKSHEELEQYIDELQTYYEDEIFDTVVDLVQDDDAEYQELNQLQAAGMERSLISPYAIKNLRRISDVSDDSARQGPNLRRRRSGLRSNSKHKNQGPRSVIQTTNKLKAIPELLDDGRDQSSSEKPVLRNKLCETILEERDADEFMSDEESDLEFSESSQIQKLSQQMEEIDLEDDQNRHQNSLRKLHSQLQRDKEARRGIMSKISKKMARDFEQNKKKSLLLSHSGSSCTQINEQRQREDYQDGRTVYKISKHKSISPINASKQSNRRDSIDDLLDRDLNVSNNLSMQFDHLHNSEPREKEDRNISYQSDQMKEQQLSVTNIQSQPLLENDQQSKQVKNRMPTRGKGKVVQNSKNVQQTQKSNKSYESISEFDNDVQSQNRDEMISQNDTVSVNQIGKPNQRGPSQKRKEEQKIVSKAYKADPDVLNHQPQKVDYNQRMTRNRMRSISQSSSIKNESSYGQSQNRGQSRKNNNHQDSSSYDSDMNSDSNDVDVFDFMKSNLSRNKGGKPTQNQSFAHINNAQARNLNNNSNNSIHQNSKPNQSMNNKGDGRNKENIPIKDIRKGMGKKTKKDYDQSSDDSDMVNNLPSKNSSRTDANRGHVGQKKGSVRGKK
eukprot:403368647